MARQNRLAEHSTPAREQTEMLNTIRHVEREAMERTHHVEMNSQELLEQHSKQGRLLTEEIYAKTLGLQMATLRGDHVEAEVARIGQLLAQERAIVQESRQGWARNCDLAVMART